MTVSTTTSRADYNGNGTTTAFAVPFYFLDNSHLTVLRTQITTGVITTLALTTNYTVTGAGVFAGGTVTCLVAPTADQKLSILRNVPLTQLNTYVPNDPFPAASHEQALDKLTMEVQQLDEALDRALTLPANTTAGTVSTSLPTPAANQVIGWNNAATGLQNIDAQTLATIVTSGNAYTDMFSGDGVQTAFNLSSNPGSVSNLSVSISGVVQRPTVDYTWVSGTTLTFTAAPASGTNNILVQYTNALPQGVSVKDAQTFDTVATVTASSVDVSVNHIRTAGYYATGDGGGALYKRVTSGSTGAGTPRITSNSGVVIWELSADPILNVQQFGAYNDDTNAATTTAAFQAAAAFSKTVYVPRGTFAINGTVVISLNGAFWFGAGQDNSTITSSSASAPMFTINAFLQGVQFRDMFLTRSVAATSGGHGISSGGVSIGKATFENLRIKNQWNGMNLGPTDWSKISHVTCENNYNIGFAIVCTATDGTSQWYLQNCLAQFNTTQGYLWQAVSGPAQMLVGTMENCATYANTGVGCGFIGLAGVPLNDVRIDGGFYGDSGNSEIYLDTYGDQHMIANAFVELAGTGLTGRTFSTPASNIGNGVECTANNSGVLISNLHINGCSRNGIRSSAGTINVANTRVTNCGQSATAGERNGVYASAGRATVVGGRFSNTSGVSQSFGVRAADGSNITIVGADLTNNGTSATSFDANGTSATIVGCLPNTLNTEVPIIQVNAGTAAAPTITTDGDPNTGIYFVAADKVGVTTGGTLRATFSDNGSVAIGSANTIPGATGYSAFLSLASNNAGIGSPAANEIGIVCANTEVLRSTSTGNKLIGNLGFYNTTPIAQPNTTGTTTGFTAGTGTAVNDASTFTGGVGTRAYRISDIVKALKDLGLIASS